MNARLFFEGVGILAKYHGERIKHNGDPETRVRFGCVQFGGADADRLRAIGWHEDASHGTSWYCDTSSAQAPGQRGEG